MDIYTELTDLLTGWKFPNNYHRYNCNGLKKKVQYGKDKISGHFHKIGYPCESMTFGRIWVKFCKKEDRIRQSPKNEKYPKVWELLKKLGGEVLPEDFNWTTVTLNHNYKCLPHTDGTNRDISAVVSWGNFTGGCLILHDKEKNPIESIDIYHKPYIFDGSKITHSVEEFEGERWSAVFYSN